MFKFLLIAFLIGLSFPVQAAQADLTTAYLLYCEGETAKADKLLDSILKRDPNDYFASSLRNYFLPDRLSKNAQLIADKYPEGIPESESERLDLARALMHLEAPNIDRVRELLDFFSKNKSIESLRLFTLAGFTEGTKPDHDEDQVLKLYEEAFELYGELEPSLLHPLVVAGQETDYARSVVRKYRPMINEIPKSDPWHEYLHLEVKLVDEEIDFVGALGPIKVIRDSCPIDLQFRYSYGIIASYSGHPQLAYQEFQSLAQTLEPWAGLYFYWGTAASSVEKYHEALRYFELAESKGPWLRPQYQEAIDEWRPFIKEALQQKERMIWITIGAGILLLSVAIGSFVVLRSIYKRLRANHD